MLSLRNAKKPWHELRAAAPREHPRFGAYDRIRELYMRDVDRHAAGAIRRRIAARRRGKPLVSKTSEP
jgi:hypothetical protein